MDLGVHSFQTNIQNYHETSIPSYQRWANPTSPIQLRCLASDHQTVTGYIIDGEYMVNIWLIYGEYVVYGGFQLIMGVPQ